MITGTFINLDSTGGKDIENVTMLIVTNLLLTNLPVSLSVNDSSITLDPSVFFLQIYKKNNNDNK